MTASVMRCREWAWCEQCEGDMSPRKHCLFIQQLLVNESREVSTRYSTNFTKRRISRTLTLTLSTAVAGHMMKKYNTLIKTYVPTCGSGRFGRCT